MQLLIPISLMRYRSEQAVSIHIYFHYLHFLLKEKLLELQFFLLPVYLLGNSFLFTLMADGGRIASCVSQLFLITLTVFGPTISIGVGAYLLDSQLIFDCVNLFIVFLGNAFEPHFDQGPCYLKDHRFSPQPAI